MSLRVSPDQFKAMQAIARDMKPHSVMGIRVTAHAGINNVPAQVIVGATGPSGERGPSGVVGATGPSGERGLSGMVGATGPSGERGLSGMVGATGPSGERGLSGVDGVQHFWAGSVVGITGTQLMLAPQTASNSSLITLSNSTITIPSGVYTVVYTINAVVATGTNIAKTVVTDSNGPLVVSTSEHEQESVLRTQQFSGSLAKLYPAGSSLSISSSGIASIKNGSLIITKLH